MQALGGKKVRVSLFPFIIMDSTSFSIQMVSREKLGRIEGGHIGMKTFLKLLTQTMAIRVGEFSSGGYKIRKMFA